MPSRVNELTVRPWAVFAVVCAGTFMAQLDLFIVNIAFPSIRAGFGGSSSSSLAWVLDAYAIVFAACLVPAGRLTDLFGRRRGYLGGLTVFALASIVCAVAPSLEVLIAGRALQAIGAAAMVPSALALLLPAFPPDRRAMAIGAWSSVGAAAAASGPPIGGLLVEASWRWIFLVNVPVAAVTLVAGTRVLREIRHPDDGGLPDLLGALVLIGAIGGLVLGIVEGPQWGWGSPRVLAAFAAAVVLGAVFLRRCARHPVPVVELELLRERSFAAANAVMLVFFVAFGAMLLNGVLFLTSVWHHGSLRAGFELAVGPAVVVGVSFVARRLVDRVGPRAVVVAGAVCFVVAAAWWRLRLGAGVDYAGAYLPAMFLAGAGVGLTQPTLFGVAAAALPANRLSTGTAILNMSRQIGLAIGVAVVIAIAGEGVPTLGALRDNFVVMGVCGALCALAALVLMRRPRRVRAADAAAAAPALSRAA
jgi:EmrB/QacA subfamily drug resistance transporter